jgi:mannosyl-3-phosphoglycerate phosphatase
MKLPLVFSDLDGTLLDHHDYTFSTAVPALEELRYRHIPLILNSSKTLAEIMSIRTELKNEHPFIVENGAAIYIPQNYFTEFTQSLNQHMLGIRYEQILAIIHSLRDQQHFKFKGFADFSAQELCLETGLSIGQSNQAKQRAGSEPIKWLDSQQSLNEFKTAIEQKQLRLVKGGRFIHVMGQNDKATAMFWLKEKYRQKLQQDILLIALGDSENDREMLEDADIAAVVRSGKGPSLQLSKPKAAVIYTKAQAPAGWLEAMNIIFKRINTGELT